MSHLLYLMFRCDFDVMESLKSLEELEGREHSLYCKQVECSKLGEGVSSVPGLSVPTQFPNNFPLVSSVECLEFFA